ncbi:RAD57 [Candida theae]|uniref:RAD57 n=1 Tax=Candida theae TaxID=1198502 RepID=A0AAD5BCA7_9ASCO|nr:RAD57 [Candida theae]KAI5950470.1 RAD57 [Candida theae]
MDDFKQLDSGGFQSSHKFPYLVGLLSNYGKSVVDLIHYYEDTDDYSELAKLINRPVGEIFQYFKALQNDLVIQPSDVDGLFDEEEAISTGLPFIDQELRGDSGGVGGGSCGGIPFGEVTEVFGASGCGKSQFLYQLLRNCVMQYPHSKPIHIATETFMESKRLADMFESDLDGREIDTKLDQIRYIYCPDLESQDHILFTQLPTKLLQDKSHTKLLVVDSIAHHFRREDSTSNVNFLKDKIEEQAQQLEGDVEFQELRRTKNRYMKLVGNKTTKYATRSTKLHYLSLMYRHLTRLAREFNIAIVVVNQVSDHTADFAKAKQSIIDDEDLSYPLNLDFQIPIASGWDPKAIFKYLPPSHVQLNERDLELLDLELQKSFDSVSSSNKRQKVTDENGTRSVPVEEDPRLNKKRIVDLRESQADLIRKAHELKNKSTKRIVPTMGYPWATRIQNRIMLMKTYKPQLKTREELVKENEANGGVDLETGLSYAQLCEGFNLGSTGSREQSQKSLQQQKQQQQQSSGSKSSTSSSVDPKSSVSSLIKGWQVERFIKVVQSTHNASNDRFKNYAFTIGQGGLKQA